MRECSFCARMGPFTNNTKCVWCKLSKAKSELKRIKTYLQSDDLEATIRIGDNYERPPYEIADMIREDLKLKKTPGSSRP